MNDYINRQLAMNAFAERVKRSNNSDFAPAPTWNDAVEIVENLPSSDAVEVVRCKDCKHADEYYHCIFSTIWNDKNHYCGKGDRKDG